MDVRTICLGILTRGDATGYEIKKLFEEGHQHFVEASFGSIYPALNRMTEEGLVSVRAEAQEKRPDRKVYSITPAGRTAFIGALLKPLEEDRHRSPFLFAMLFSDLLPRERVSALLDSYIEQVGKQHAEVERYAQLQEQSTGLGAGERFVMGFGRAMYAAMLEYMELHRHEIEQAVVSAAE